MQEISKINLNKLIGTQQAGLKASENNEAVINHIMRCLKSMKTGWRAGFKTETEVNLYKQELLKACIENKVNTIEMVEIGLAKARRDDSDFFPSVGKFINWCLKTDEHWEHKGAAYREWRPERLLPKVTSEELKEIGNKHLNQMKENLRRKQ